MIFGFNTDVKHGDTVYHVQSEANPHASLLLTTIFVKGRYLGKKTSSYPSDEIASDAAEQRVHELLKEQHRQVLEAIRAGEVEKVIAASSSN
jgi:DNA-binding FadR family transcriptional regulator